MRTIIAVAVAALSTAAFAQVGTDPVENKIPADQLATDAVPPTATATPAVGQSTDDAPPSAQADAPATATPVPPAATADPTNASGPPPKR